MNNRALFLASLASPLAIPATFVVSAIYEGISYGETSMALLFYVPAAYLVAAVFGVPLFLLFGAAGWKSVFAYILGGAGGGLAAALLIRELSYPDAGLPYFAFWAAGAALSGLVFRLILSVAGYDASPGVSAGAEI